MKVLPAIDLKDLSRYRGEMMGVATLFVVLFHVWLKPTDPFFGLRRCGNIGVDIFLLISGIGLWHAWQKNPSVRHFLHRRYRRIYPTWLVVATAYYLPEYIAHGGGWRDLPMLIGQITIGWGFWAHDELTFWYMPAIIVLYAIALFYLRLIDRHAEWRWLPVLFICWCVAVRWVTPVHAAVGHIEIFWSRAPIFFIGINMGAAVRDGRPGSTSATLLALITLLTVGGMCMWLEQFRHGRFPLFVERMLYIPLTVAFLLLLGAVLRHTSTWARQALAFVGALSLEVYLIHLNFVLLPLAKLHWGYWENVLATLALTLPMAWALHYVIAFAASLRKNKKK